MSYKPKDMKPNTIQSIKNWAIEDRPREKMLEKGREALSDAELIAILIGSGNHPARKGQIPIIWLINLH